MINIEFWKDKHALNRTQGVDYVVFDDGEYALIPKIGETVQLRNKETYKVKHIHKDYYTDPHSDAIVHVWVEEIGRICDCIDT